MKWTYSRPIFEYNQADIDLTNAWLGHRNFAYDLISAVHPKKVVELGTHYGTSFFSMCQAVKDKGFTDTSLVAIDTWKGDHQSGYYGEDIFSKVQSRVSSHYSNLSIRLIRKTFDEAVREFADKSISVLHIDGLHTYDAVSHDFKTWYAKVTDDGIILFHDIHTRQTDFGVYKFWEEIKQKHHTIEFFHAYGLGVVFKNKETYDRFAPFEDVWQQYYPLVTDEAKYMGEISQLSHELNEHRQVKLLLEGENAGLQKTFREFEGASLNNSKNLQTKNFELDKEIYFLKSSLFSAELNASNVQSENQELKQEVSLLAERLNIADNALKKASQKISDAVKINELLKHDSQSLTMRISNLESLVQRNKTEREKIEARTSELQKKVEDQDRYIHWMSMSRFWKLRGEYLRCKWALLNPLKFCKKYIWSGIPAYPQIYWAVHHPSKFVNKYTPRPVFQKIYRDRTYLLSETLRHVRDEGMKPTVNRVRNYILFGRGTLYTPSVQLEVPSDLYETNYYHWIKGIEGPFLEKLSREKEAMLASFSYLPKISVLMPAYNSDEIFFRKAIFSVINQWYPNWELCIADDHSSHKAVKIVLDELRARNDPRIKIKECPTNGGISIATNQALELATGEFAAFLDHDDEIAPYALFLFVSELQKNKNIDISYSDCDKITESGYRYEPEFKPIWSPELLVSMAYTTHFRIIRKKLIDEVGGLRKEFDGSQDYDLMLRVSEHAKNILHIPWILYHWRAIPGSAAFSTNEKPYAQSAGMRALQEALVRRNIPGTAVVHKYASNTSLFKIDFNQKLIRDKISIIIPTKDGVDVLRKCIASIKRLTKYPNYEIVVINNNSTKQETFDYFKSGGFRVIDIPTKSFNFAHINNKAVEMVDSEYIVFLNNDTEVINPDWLLEFIGTMKIRDSIGVVGAKLLYPNNTVQHVGITMILTDNIIAHHVYRDIEKNNCGPYGYAAVLRNYSAVTAACMMVRKSIFQKLGGFDERRFAVSYNDVDFCLRAIKAGYACVFNPDVLLYHHESFTREAIDIPEESANMMKTWSSVYPDYDPYYSRHFERLPPDFTFKKNTIYVS